MSNDFLAFCRKLDIVSKTGIVQLNPNPCQVARDAARTPRDLILKARQTGSTTFELARDVWYAATHASSRVVVLIDGTYPESLRCTAKVIAGMLASGAGREVVPTVRKLGDARWQIGDSILEIVEAGASMLKAMKRGRAGTIHRLHTMETGYIENARAIVEPLLDCVPPADTGTEIVHESTVGPDRFFFALCNGSIDKSNGYALFFAGWMQIPAYSLPVALDEIVEPTGTREIAIANLGGTPAQVNWYRRQVLRRGQAGTDLEYPIYALAALDPTIYDRPAHHVAA